MGHTQGATDFALAREELRKAAMIKKRSKN